MKNSPEYNISSITINNILAHSLTYTLCLFPRSKFQTENPKKIVLRNRSLAKMYCWQSNVYTPLKKCIGYTTPPIPYPDHWPIRSKLEIR